jgi:hypothetical protein
VPGLLGAEPAVLLNPKMKKKGYRIVLLRKSLLIHFDKKICWKGKISIKLRNIRKKIPGKYE